MPKYVALKRLTLRDGQVWQPGDTVAAQAFAEEILEKLIAKGAVGIAPAPRKRKEG